VSDRLRIVVSGLMGSLPLGGLIAHYLQYVLVLRALGHDVLYLEDTGWYWDPWSRTYCDQWNGATVPEAARPPAFLDRLMRGYGLQDAWTYVDIAGQRFGVHGRRLADFLRSADLYVHVTGAGIMRDEYIAIPHRAYVDTDPGFLQMSAATSDPQHVREHLANHTVYFSFGCNIGSSGCVIPTLGLTWHPTVQPLVLDLWPPAPAPAEDAPFTTVIKWRPYDPVVYDGVAYGMKDVEFVKFLPIPTLASERLELAIEGDSPVSAERLERLGWRVRSAWGVTKSLPRYREYIHESKGEWAVAKNCYVATRSGWFSERSAAYLASGRPTVVQATGFEDWLPTGEGVIPFTTIDECLSGLTEIAGDYDRHSRAAREIAEEFFEAGRILSPLVEISMTR